MKLTLSQWGIIKELIADEAEAVGCDYENMKERYERNKKTGAFSDDKEYQEAKAELAEVKERLNELNRILDKFDEEF